MLEGRLFNTGIQRVKRDWVYLYGSTSTVKRLYVMLWKFVKRLFIRKGKMTKLCAIHIEKVTNNNNNYYISVLHSCSDDNHLSWLNRHLELIGQAAFL